MGASMIDKVPLENGPVRGDRRMELSAKPPLSDRQFRVLYWWGAVYFLVALLIGVVAFWSVGREAKSLTWYWQGAFWFTLAGITVEGGALRCALHRLGISVWPGKSSTPESFLMIMLMGGMQAFIGALQLLVA
jgi:hypothetical protein